MSLSKWVASKEDVSGVREKLAAIKQELKEYIAAVRENMAKPETGLIKWFMGTSITLTGVFSGIVFAIVKPAG